MPLAPRPLGFVALLLLAGCSNASTSGGIETGGAAPTAGNGAGTGAGSGRSGGGSAGVGGVGTGGSTSGTGGASGSSAAGGVASGGVASGGRNAGGGTTTGGSDAGGEAGMGEIGGIGAQSGSAGQAVAGTAALAGAGGAAGAPAVSSGCGKAPSLENSTSTTSFTYNSLTSGGVSRRYILRLPESYDNTHPYRLILGFHGATNNAGNVAGNPAFFGLYALAEGSAIFVAPEAVDGIWSASSDLVYVDDVLAAIEADLCIDTSRILLEGFSQGGAMVQTLACARPSVFRAAAGHSSGGLARPSSCEPIPYFGSLGQDENGGQETQTDFFAMTNGCTVEALPEAPAGGHRCSDYTGCSAGYPVRWCPYDGGHTASPNDSGQSSSWMPSEVWPFLNQF